MQIGRHSATFVSTSLEAVPSRRNAHKSPAWNLWKTRGSLPSIFLYSFIVSISFSRLRWANVVSKPRSDFPLYLHFSTPSSSSFPLFEGRTRWNVYHALLSQDLRVIDGQQVNSINFPFSFSFWINRNSLQRDRSKKINYRYGSRRW